MLDISTIANPLIEQDKHLGVVEGCREALRREV